MELPGHEKEKALLADLARIVGKYVTSIFPKMGFAIVLFDFGEGGNFFYASNALRDDMIKMFQEAIDKLTKEKENETKH